MNECDLRGSQTEQSLVNAFAGESQARNRYTYFAAVAKNEGYEQISAIFLETADNELAHAKLFYKYLGEAVLGVNANYPFALGNTYQNLLHAASGEHDEWSKIYYDAAKIAENEGFKDIANTFWHVIEVEKHHEVRYLTLAEHINKSEVFKKDFETNWICRNCGYIVYGLSAPNICPSCKYPQSYFEIFCERY